MACLRLFLASKPNLEAVGGLDSILKILKEAAKEHQSEALYCITLLDCSFPANLDAHAAVLSAQLQVTVSELPQHLQNAHGFFDDRFRIPARMVIDEEDYLPAMKAIYDKYL